MVELLQLLGFTFLLLRFFYWVGSSLTLHEKKWNLVLLSQCIEGFLLLFIFSQIVGKIYIFPIQHSPWQVLVGLFLVILGTSAAVVAKKQLGNAWVYAALYGVKPKQQLITTGIYSLVRHPIYSSFALSYVGAELLAGSWLWCAFCLLFIPVYLQARKEDVLLAKHFGKRYGEYRARTKMLIPFLF